MSVTELDAKDRRNPGVVIVIDMKSQHVVVKWQNATSPIRNAMLVMALELAKGQLLARPTTFTPDKMPHGA